MSEHKRTYKKTEQASLCLALSDVTLRARIQCPNCLRLDAFNFNKLKNDNLGLKHSRGCGKTVASGYIHKAIISLIGVTSSCLRTILLELPQLCLSGSKLDLLPNPLCWLIEHQHKTFLLVHPIMLEDA
ncbi:hypothetical protein DSO57_1032766 [Entomophthora muscae]|uniref:Uncharacterized protein n=1 Tax=Entomophthora muscae TaxID=34485 RepID=A0ACC2TBI6_9FUNG|nr:hypothetical protein DSO57_1032766 [Entomophthora muscae]